MPRTALSAPDGSLAALAPRATASLLRPPRRDLDLPALIRLDPRISPARLTRTPPIQARAIETVSRLVAAVSTRLRLGQSGPLSLRGLASEAGVTSQAAYRYFHDLDHLMTFTFRCWRIQSVKSVCDEIGAARFETREELAHFLAEATIDKFETLLQLGPFRAGAPGPWALETPHDVWWVCAARLCGGKPVRDDALAGIETRALAFAGAALDSAVRELSLARLDPGAEAQARSRLGHLALAVLESRPN
jgi:AcrR family transcriptional regulator